MSKNVQKEPWKENGFLQNHIICNLESDELSYATRYQRQPWRKITIIIGGVLNTRYFVKPLKCWPILWSLKMILYKRKITLNSTNESGNKFRCDSGLWPILRFRNPRVDNSKSTRNKTQAQILNKKSHLPYRRNSKKRKFLLFVLICLSHMYHCITFLHFKNLFTVTNKFSFKISN